MTDGSLQTQPLRVIERIALEDSDGWRMIMQQ